MFQDSSKKGREKMYVSRPNAMMISSGATVAAQKNLVPKNSWRHPLTSLNISL